MQRQLKLTDSSELLAALPQHIWEVTAGAMAISLIGLSILRFRALHETDASVSSFPDQTGDGFPHRLGSDGWIAAVQLTLGVGLTIAVFVLDPNSGCRPCQEAPWGGPSMLAAMGFWLLLVGWATYREARSHLSRSARS